MSAPRGVRVLLGLLTLAVAVYAVSLVPGVRPEPGFHSGLDGWLNILIWLASAIPCLARAVLVPRERAAWSVLAVALLLYSGATVYYYAGLAHLEVIPYPSLADAGWISFYPLAYVAVVLLLRVRVTQFHRSMWLDGLVAALGVGALVTATLLGPLLAAKPGHFAAVATAITYPVADLLLLTLVVAVCGLFSWRPERSWWLLAAGLAVQAVTDMLYLTEVAEGSFTPGDPLSIGWAVSVLLLAYAPWQPSRAMRARRESVPVLLVPAVSAMVSLAVLAYATQWHVPVLGTVLAFAGVLAAIGRTGLTFHEVRQLAESRQQARTDDLTGLPNRRLFRERLDMAVARMADRPLAVLLVDLDRFKEVNDSLGHHVGDELLVEAGRRLSGRLHAQDVLARLGGDEFAVLLPGTDDRAAVARSRDLVAALHEPFLLAGMTVHVEASIGVASAGAGSMAGPELLRRADVAMYRAKETRATVEVYSPDIDEHSRDRLELVEALRVGLSAGQIVVHYQPKINLATDSVVGVEALTRWEHPDRGLVYPDTFLPLAEQAGLMRALTDVVLTESLDQCARWRRSGIELTVAVNLSASSLLDTGLPRRVAALLEERALPADALELEITESVLMLDRVRSIEVLLALRDLGVRAAVDDYGTGYSSLAYLRELPVNELKLDRSFVMNLDEDPLAAAIVQSTVGLAHSLGLRMVAEGVENAAALEQLRRYGCDLAQGYHIGRPQPASQLTRWLHGNADLGRSRNDGVRHEGLGKEVLSR